jgi:hypothetical protein
MTLVPSWQQQQGTLLVPAPEDWRRPILTDNAQGIRFAQGRRNYCFLKSAWRVNVKYWSGIYFRLLCTGIGFSGSFLTTLFKPPKSLLFFVGL